ncbi:hypothetical protein L798_07715 [Zootermopsis nevadensis]|uniref:Uncharacterized protein n=1 Tax=Zootermopsis nevadensis TaxID=136037 RepID=A0A067RG55_ZOONE|nr:hypothetical protein L798_07715 [Zootermopsis nevadensis]
MSFNQCWFSLYNPRPVKLYVGGWWIAGVMLYQGFPFEITQEISDLCSEAYLDTIRRRQYTEGHRVRI